MEYYEAKICLGDGFERNGIVAQTINYGIISLDMETEKFQGIFTFDYVCGSTEDLVIKNITLYEGNEKNDFLYEGLVADLFGNPIGYFLKNSVERTNRTDMIFYIISEISDEEVIARYEKNLKSF